MEQKGDITFEMVMPNGGVDEALETAKKLCEANLGLTLHIVFKDAYCCNAGANMPLPPPWV